MVKVFLSLIRKGILTINDVPENDGVKEQVEQLLTIPEN